MPIRPATLADLSALLELEQRSFTSNILSRRAMRHALNNPQALVLVDENKVLRGALIMFQHSRSRLARLYSLAVDPDFRRQGIAENLLKTAEAQTIKPGLKLEIRVDNAAAMALYLRLGYRERRKISNFYEDGCTAVEMVKEVGFGI